MRPGTSAPIAEIVTALNDHLPAARALRRALHAAPEVSGAETRTRDAILEHLPDGALTPVAGTGAIIRFGGIGSAVAVRAELDALPITECTKVDWASTDGAMHACGHDVHMAAAAALAHCWPLLPVPLTLVLQPREETYPSGAQDVIASGVLQDNQVASVIAAHVQPLLDHGTVAASPGAVNASSDEFQVTMRGVGGHAAYPHLGPDPVLALAQFVMTAQQLVSRNSNPTVATVVSVCMLAAGESPNIRPGEAVARGTVRALDAEHRDLLLRRVKDVADGVAHAAGCHAEIELQRGEPALVNHPAIAASARRHLGALGATPNADLYSCGADDFAFYSERLPSLMMFVGTGRESGHLHHPAFLPDDRAVDEVAKALLAGVLAAADSVIGA